MDAKERAAFEYLMSLPVDNPERQSLRDAVPYGPKKLDTLTRKYLASEWHKPIDYNKTNKEPIYPAWTRGITQSKPGPFESGGNTLPGMERFKS